jgi:hypothetical protein
MEIVWLLRNKKKGEERQNRLDSRLGPLGNNLNFNAYVSWESLHLYIFFNEYKFYI